MNPMPAPSQPEPAAGQTISRYDHVRVPDGRIGEAIGYFRPADENILVLLDSGGRRFRRSELRLATERIDSFRAVGSEDVHHNSDACKAGNVIELVDRVAGNGGVPLCIECASLDLFA
jgi:hypothetical protein